MKDLLKTLKEEIIKKEELSAISEDVLDSSILNYLNKNNFSLNAKLKEKDLKIIVKEIRDSLRLMHGRFQISSKKREKFLNSGDYEEILKTHRSTLERISIYPDVKKLIYDLKPSSILDIACGLNPIALANKYTYYVAIDINKEEIEILSSFFKKENVSARLISADAKNIDYSSIGDFDLCLIFKFLDFIEDSHKNAEFFLRNVKCKSFLVSFATKSISGRNKRQSRRIWFERIIKKLNYSFDIKEFDNEIFYLIKVS